MPVRAACQVILIARSAGPSFSVIFLVFVQALFLGGAKEPETWHYLA
jgi:hypothetical protein